jgi:hypothetical protein
MRIVMITLFVTLSVIMTVVPTTVLLRIERPVMIPLNPSNRGPNPFV